MTVISPPIRWKPAGDARHSGIRRAGLYAHRPQRAKRLFGDDHVFEIGKGQIIRHGHDVTLVACGVEVARALDAPNCCMAKGISAGSSIWRRFKPIDSELLKRCAKEDRRHRDREDHNIYAGWEARCRSGAKVHPCPIEFVGLNDTFGTSANRTKLAEHFTITAPFIAAAAKTPSHASGSAMNRFSLSGKTPSSPAPAWHRPRRRAGLADAGADVVLTFREKHSEAEKVAKQIEACGQRALILQMDAPSGRVSRRGKAAHGFGPISILVNNAGSQANGLRQVSDADWDTILATNLRGPFVCARPSLPLLAEAGAAASSISAR